MSSPFLESVRRDIRLRGYSIRTEKAYLQWIRQYIHFHHKQHPSSLGAQEVKTFLSHLASERHVAVNTQKVALNALVFLYHKVLDKDLGDLGFTLATKQRSLPVVLSQGEISKILDRLQGRNRLIIKMLYGSGLRISECLRLRVKDIDLQRCSITVKDGKGNKDRQTLLSPQLIPVLEKTIKEAVATQRTDNESGIGPSLPFALGKKYPNAYKMPGWVFIFPSTTLCPQSIGSVSLI